MFEKIRKALPAFKSLNFRLYFVGQLVSLAGTWLQTVAQGWLVLTLTHSAFWVGTVMAISYVPTFLFSLFGGVLVDKFDRRKTLFVTQVSAMLLAFTLGGLVIAGMATLTWVIVMAALLGVVNAADIPARQAFVSEIVPKEDYASAFALTSALTNGARVIGPALAGILIALVGTGGAFIINGLTFLAVIIALLFIKVSARERPAHPPALRMIADGLRYTFTHPALRTVMLAASLTAIFGYSYSALLPVFADSVFARGATGLGYLYGAAGIGAVIAALAISAFAKHSKLFILGGSSILTLALIVFSLSHNFILGLVALLFVGFGFTAEFSMINTLVQRVVSDHMRGRVMSVFILMFIGATPIGTFSVGALAEHFGAGRALLVFAFVMIFITLWLFSSFESSGLSGV